jgi:hypothetical protein
MVMTHAQKVARIIAKHLDRAEMTTAQSIVAMSPLGQKRRGRFVRFQSRADVAAVAEG